jgi:hypothetical protein
MRLVMVLIAAQRIMASEVAGSPSGLRTTCTTVARMARAQSTSLPAKPPSAKTNRTGLIRYAESRVARHCSGDWV